MHHLIGMCIKKVHCSCSKDDLFFYMTSYLLDKKKSSEGGGDVVTEETPHLTSADISYYLEKELSKESIELLSNKNMGEAIHEFVDKNEPYSVTT